MENNCGVLVEFAPFIQNLSDLAGDGPPEMSARLERVILNTPIELEVEVNEDGSVHLNSGPPTQQIETTFMPVFHSLRLVVTSEDAT